MTKQFNLIEQRTNLMLEEVIKAHQQGESYLLSEDGFECIVEYITLLKKEKQELIDTLKSCEHQLFNARGA